MDQKRLVRCPRCHFKTHRTWHYTDGFGICPRGCQDNLDTVDGYPANNGGPQTLQPYTPTRHMVRSPQRTA